MFGKALAFAAFLLTPAYALAATLVLSVSGGVDPPVEAFEEPEIGDKFYLSDDAEMTLLHYNACKEIHVRGGRVTIARRAVEATGELLSETPVNCPRKVAFQESTSAVAAVVLRDVAPGADIALRPVFVALDANVHLVEVSHDGGVVQRLAVENGVARWPDGAEPLAHGKRYMVSLLQPDGRLNSAVLAKKDAGPTVVRR